ncbi:arad-like aldolase/epimerase [Tuber magnatum]|uniref:Arad-like aldolase/epimerase n=1 Tax=Tuber magnatum TaxID=42249 RepID=A0A317STW3_9PEZI|nr:arad-like aldolase/epimerase [Tuber magnatum]
MTSTHNTPTAEAINVPLEDRMGYPEPGASMKSESGEIKRQYLKERLAAGFRVFAKYGFDEAGVAGHISLRDPINPQAFWFNPFGLHFSLIKASDLLLVDGSGKVIDGGANRYINVAGFKIHSAIHKARPDVNCAAHTHSLYGRTFCALGKTLDIITQDSCAFYNDHALYKDFRGIVLEEDEGIAIAECLGTNKAALLQNHGLLTTGGTVEETVFWFLSLDKCCYTQLLADAAAAGRGGTTKKIGDKEAMDTWKIVGSSKGGHFAGSSIFDLIEVETKGDYKN